MKLKVTLTYETDDVSDAMPLSNLQDILELQTQKVIPHIVYDYDDDDNMWLIHLQLTGISSTMAERTIVTDMTKKKS